MRRPLSYSVLALVLACMLAPTAAWAQSEAISIDDVNDDEYPIVEVTVSVPPELSEQQLSKEPFTITENGRTVQPYLGSSPEAEAPPPPQVALAIDVSKSMEDSIARAREAADNFVADLPEDSLVGLVTFGDRARTLVEPTANRMAVRSRIADIQANEGSTALYAGVRRAANMLSVDAGETGNVIVLTDGNNTVDGASEEDAIHALQRQGAQLWAVALPGEQDLAALKRLTADNGKLVEPKNADELTAIYSGLATDLARTYVLRYESQADGDTDLGVTLEYGSLLTERTISVAIDGSRAAARAEPATASVDLKPIVVTVPLLGTTGAFAAGLTALAVGAFVLLLLLLLPRVTRPRERLLIDHDQAHRQRARLTTVAQWATDVADRQVHRRTLGSQLDRDLEGAGLNLRPGEIVVIILSLMVVVYVAGTLIANWMVGLLLTLFPPLLARLWLGIRRDKRHAAFADQLTDVLQLIASSLRAGYGLMQGIDAVSRDAEQPASGEFRRIIVEHRLGRDLTEAMNNCATRMNNADFSWVVQAISIHREIGGDLSKVLDNIVATIRDRADVQRQVRTLSAEGRMSARVLTALPLLVLAILIMMSPDYLSPLLAEPLGIAMIASAGLLMVVGILVIRRMSNIQY